MPDIVLIKLGGSLITDKARPETPRREVIARLAGEIARAARATSQPPDRRPRQRLLRPRRRPGVRHRGGSAPRAAPGRLQDPGTGRRPPPVGDRGAGRGRRPPLLHRAVELRGLRGRPAGRLRRRAAPRWRSTAASCRALRRRGDRPRSGDLVCPTEKLFEILTRTLLDHGRAVRRSLWLGETDGLYDAEGRTVPTISAGDLSSVRGDRRPLRHRRHRRHAPPRRDRPRPGAARGPFPPRQRPGPRGCWNGRCGGTEVPGTEVL